MHPLIQPYSYTGILQKVGSLTAIVIYENPAEFWYLCKEIPILNKMYPPFFKSNILK